MITNQEKKLIHIYKHSAQLNQAEYRELLHEQTGLHSCADPEFSHADADRVLAALEAILFDRVSRAVVPNPVGRSRWIKRATYFRDKQKGGFVPSAQQEHLVRELWLQLQEHLPQSKRNTDYLAAITRQAVGHAVGKHPLTRAECGHLIDALKDRLKHGIKTAEI